MPPTHRQTKAVDHPGTFAAKRLGSSSALLGAPETNRGFDEHLVGALEYRTPELLEEELKQAQFRDPYSLPRGFWFLLMA